MAWKFFRDYFFFFLKMYSSLTQYTWTTVSPPSTPPRSPYTSFLPQVNSVPISFQKSTGIQRQQPNMNKQNTLRQGKNLHIEAGQGNPTGGEESPKNRSGCVFHSFVCSSFIIIPWKYAFLTRMLKF